MKISIIGTGNLAWHLAWRWKSAGFEIVDIYGRNVKEAEALADLVNARPVNEYESLKKDTELIALCVRDSAITEAGHALRGKINGDSTVIHTSGTVPSSVLEEVSKNYGVWYPLQTFSKGIPVDWNGLPVYISAPNQWVRNMLFSIAEHCNALPVYCTDDQKVKIHVAAVMVNNFVNHLLGLTEDYCVKENLNFDHLKPLIFETVKKISFQNPVLTQTGPARRNDLKTIEHHLEILKAHPELKTVYETLTSSILRMYHP